ncbi:MAG: type II toxin-antitoxin system RelE/ParE family toxin [Peptococcaceae bacterium]|nr:type II toxin-antitoxin system RelE/ParE family toxin [Peptococcaceae bacterium]
MRIYYGQRQLQQATSGYNSAVRELGPENAKKLFLRIQQLEAAGALNEMVNVPGAHFHALTGNRKGQFALNLTHPKRLIVEPVAPVPRLADGGIDLSRVEEITIIEVVDYHD